MRTFKDIEKISKLFAIGKDFKNHSILFRPPGVRAIIINDKNQILLNKEYRDDLGFYDYRLPGGKTFDDISSYIDFMNDNSNNNIDDLILEIAKQTVKKECIEETGLDINNPKLLNISKNGYTVDWDLYYFLITDYTVLQTGALMEKEENIKGYEWFSFNEVFNLWKEKKINEERSSNVLLHLILDELNIKIEK